MSAEGTLEFDLGQKWAKGLRLRFYNQSESSALDRATMACPKQVHGKDLVEWSPARTNYSQIAADGIVARGPAFRAAGRPLCVRTADCAPLFFVDRENECCAAVHAGWRGLAQGIHRVPFSRGFAPATTWIWCGPCLNGPSFAVGEDMWAQFSPADQANFFVTQIGSAIAEDKKRFFKAWDFLEQSFRALGVELFYNVEIDTFTASEYASYRRWKQAGAPGNLQHNYSTLGFTAG